MTYPRIYKAGKPKTKENIDIEATKALKTRPILSNQEVDSMLEKADQIKPTMQRLRAKAIIALLKKFGKRRREISLLKVNDLLIEAKYLYVTFTIQKKHKKGLFQFLKFLKSEIKLGKLPLNYLNSRNYSQLLTEWAEWTKTNAKGSTLKEAIRTKRVLISDKYARIILEYWEFMKKNYPDVSYLFPSTSVIFGNLYDVSLDRHISGSQLLRIVKPLNEQVWLHLFRETKGAEIARQYGNSLAGITMVRDTLDLEKEETAYIYTRRYAVQEITAET